MNRQGLALDASKPSSTNFDDKLLNGYEGFAVGRTTISLIEVLCPDYYTHETF
jgi:hypothetical protein